MTSAYVRAAVNGEVDRVERAQVGERNHALFRASARLGSFVAAGTLAESAARRALSNACSAHIGVEGFHTGEARRTIDSGLRFGMRPATGFGSNPQTRYRRGQLDKQSFPQRSC